MSEERTSAVVTLRVRLAANEAHYGTTLVDGARMLGLFGDVATELCIRDSGDEGLFAGYEFVHFLAPVHAGSFIEAQGQIVRYGTRSRTMIFEARRVIAPRRDISESAAELLPEAVVVCRAKGTCVVPERNERA